MKALAATAGIMFFIFGFSIAAPVFGFFMGIAAAAFLLFALFKDHFDTVKKQKEIEKDG